MADTKAYYLDLLEDCLLNLIYEDPPQGPWKRQDHFSRQQRELGHDWPSQAHSMIGKVRMRYLRLLTEDVVDRNVPGDLIETGIWRGGACIMMRAVLKAYGDTTRTVWCADSFEGLPKPDEKYEWDKNDKYHSYDELRISLEEVQSNFSKYGLLDDQVKFLKGWFKDTLHLAPIEKLAILRLDGDMYQSTIEALDALYHKVSSSGYIIVDDYNLKNCRQAIHDFRETHGITAPMIKIDKAAIFWQKS
jgi:hypothetical protein